jgi:sugar/nucleoside kinase (ribokinase family)
VSFDVLVLGPLFTDILFTGLPHMPVLGTEIYASDYHVTVGGSAIVASGLHRLGAKVALIADLGNDPLSRVAEQILSDIGLDMRYIRRHDYALPQVTVGLSFPQDRAFVTRFVQPEEPHPLREMFGEANARHLHVCSFLAALGAPDAPIIAREYGMTVSLDPGWDEQALRDPRLHAFVAETDIFMPSRSEILAMMDVSGTGDEVIAVQVIARTMLDNSLIVMKRGADGASAFSNEERVDVPAVAVEPVDTTGAGDSFDAGYLYAYTQGYPLKECLRYGAVCGGLSTTRIGGIEVFPSLGEVKQWLRESQ